MPLALSGYVLDQLFLHRVSVSASCGHPLGPTKLAATERWPDYTLKPAWFLVNCAREVAYCTVKPVLQWGPNQLAARPDYTAELVQPWPPFTGLGPNQFNCACNSYF